MGFFSNLFGSNQRELNKLAPLVVAVNQFSDKISQLSDENLADKTREFKKRLADGETLEDILPEAFAVVREAADRVIGERHFDVQILGGIVLHQGKIAEMKTGEGKTLTATLPIYLNALTGKGVHVVTVNDYLAKRDCNWMGSIFHFLGISTACILHDTSYLYEPKIVDKDSVSVEMENLKAISRREAYAADITYGTNNEFGFDYLRDNMVQSLDQMSQRELNYAIVDEVDSILIDEARTPLIISAPDAESTKLYQRFAQIVASLKSGDDYNIDEKMRSATLTDQGISRVEEMLGMGNIYETGKISLVHHLEQALKAEVLFKRDKDYVVKDDQVIIVDDFTGRLMHGRRYSEGLHQAIEAKEHVSVQKESRTLATITFQNYFRMYKKMSGMTGTALTSAEEFFKVYHVPVLEIPTNQPLRRKDWSDIIYKNEEGKFKAIAEKIKELNIKGQPVLVGTIAVEKSEALSVFLDRSGVKHEILNAKNHEREAQIIAEAGQKGAVTIATNMAGRGTDIKLGEGVKDLGGLFIIGTERHEARRIDNQLRGRAGRQGDPGESQFYVSLEDELMRRFGGDKLKNMMESLGLPEDQPIQNRIISKTIESAQNKIEGFNFDIRKHVLDYDDVMNKQREVIYKKRKVILEATDVSLEIKEIIEKMIGKTVERVLGEEENQWNFDELLKETRVFFPIEEKNKEEWERIYQERLATDEKRDKIMEAIIREAENFYAGKEREIGSANLRNIEKSLYLQIIDINWMNHLDEIDYLREGIGLRGYGQRDPLVEYKREAFNMFGVLMENINLAVAQNIFRVNVISPNASEEKSMSYHGGEENLQFSGSRGEEEKQKPIINRDKVGRNDPCPCGSGLKYKKCHGK